MFSGKGRFALRFIAVLLLGMLQPVGYAAEPDTDDYTPTVLVTGSSRGLGLEFVRQYAADGLKVIATARDPAAATELQALAAKHANIVIEPLDVTDLAQIDSLAGRYKDQPIDVLLNNAAVSGVPSNRQVFGRIDFALFDDFMHTNARGPLKISEAFLPHLRAGKQKRLVVVSSIGGSFSAPPTRIRGTLIYRASKAALNMLMVNVAQAVERYGITVVLLNPGLVDTQGGLAELNEKLKMNLNLVPIDESIAGMRKVLGTAAIHQSGHDDVATG